MDKNAIKKYAVWARRELISRVSQRAALYEITDKGYGDASADSVLGRVMSAEEKRQRQALIAQIREKGYEQVMEEIAYTWFNRFIALRFMEVNGYLPSRVRVFTDDENNFKPQILAEAINMELDGLDMEKVYALKNANDDDALFKYMIIVQCNALNRILPRMFQRIEDYTELLLPDYLLREGSVIQRLIIDIPERDFDVLSGEGQVEIIGWLYQFYIAEKHDSVIDPLRGKVVKKEDIPAATQLFTTDWVVRYLIDNSVGRYWVERNPNSTLLQKLTFYVAQKDNDANTIKEKITPQELSVFDPCVGSGHFLVYAFDVLMEIYKEYGYSERDAAAEILKNNLFGLDIDGRAVQLAYFALMMKARQYDRRFFTREIQPNIFEIKESNNVDVSCVDYFCANDGGLKADIKTLIDTLLDAKEFGSLLQIPTVDFKKINDRFSQLADEISIYSSYLRDEFYALIHPAELMMKKYSVVATNPPYFTKYDENLKHYLIQNYKAYSGDLFSVFTYRNPLYCKDSGYCGMMTPNVWLSIKSYEPLRREILNTRTILTLVQMAHGAFNEVACVDVCAFVLASKKYDIDGVYFKLSDHKGDMDYQKEKVLEALHEEVDYKFYAKANNLSLVPESPITAYSASERMLRIYDRAVLLSTVADPKQGLATADNNRFLRQWFEVDIHNISFNCKSLEETEDNGIKWYPYNKGGDFRRWYGNNDYVVNWEHNGAEIRSFTDDKGKLRSRPQNTQYYFKECISWSLISSYTIAFRYKPVGHIFDIAGMSCFDTSDIPLLYLLALNNSCLIGKIMLMLAPTINYQSGNIANIPVIYDESVAADVCALSQSNVEIAKEDWDEFETSWDFKSNPLVRHRGTRSLEKAYAIYVEETNARFMRLAENEASLNKLFLRIYDVEGEISPAINRRDISATYIYENKEAIPSDIKESYYVRTKAEIIRYFIMYSVGCMFGRYSLDVPGLIYAGGNWDTSNYTSYLPDKDAIIPICDDEYFEDDIVGRFVSFVETVYGKETLEDNLQFIASALGGNGAPREVIRNYFLNDFYADHLKVYQKRPIYWLFDSGKKNGFKCLVYMHRYQPDTIARIRTDYVHEQQSRYRTAIADLEQRLNGASTSERVKLNKQLTTLQAQAEEIRVYEEKIHHLADQMIRIDLDDGVKHNYAIFQDVLAKIK